MAKRTVRSIPEPYVAPKGRKQVTLVTLIPGRECPDCKERYLHPKMSDDSPLAFFADMEKYDAVAHDNVKDCVRYLATQVVRLETLLQDTRDDVQSLKRRGTDDY